ncbi:hypothetical protein AB0H63_11610 [Micromonospora echinospora]|uniref:hypothetical protein n=1 Tax=Micromonospora echinospora TaxID=1877 RepID=UPI0033E7E6D7
MAVFTYLHVVVSTRLAELRRDGERGDSPVPTAVIIAGLVIAAAAVTAAVLDKANDWMASIDGPGAQ